MSKENGNGQRGTIADLVAAMVEELGEVRGDLGAVRTHLDGVDQRLGLMDERMARVALMMAKVGDVLTDHEQRLTVLESAP